MLKRELYNLISEEMERDGLGPRQLYLATNWYMSQLVDGQFIDHNLFMRKIGKFGANNPIQVKVSSETGEIKEIRFGVIDLLKQLKVEHRSIKEQVVLATIVAAEHLAVTLLMSLGKYINKNMLEFAKGKSMYAYNGPLFDCTMKEYLNYEETVKGIVYVQTVSSGRSRFNLLSNISNSCFLDALLFSLIVSSVDPIREAIFDFDPEAYDYSYIDEATQEARYYPTECTTSWARGLKVREFNSYTFLTQRLLKKYANAILYGNQQARLYCTNLRKLLNRCKKEIPITEQADPMDVYATLAGMFPGLGDLRHTVIVKNKVGDKGKKRRATVPMFMFSDFLLYPDELGTSVVWNEINHPFLIFQNGMIPRITKYGKSETEAILQDGRVVLYIEKERAFKEFILDGKYRMAVAIMHRGHVGRMGAESGHYTSYIRPYNDSSRWYHYDDMGPSFTVQQSFPKAEILFDTQRSRPEIYIYEKVL